MGYSSLGFSKEIYSFVERFISKKSKEKIYILAITPYSLTSEAQKNDHFKQEFSKDKSEILHREYLNPIYYRIKRYLNLIKGNKKQINYQQSFYDTGWVASYKYSENPEEALPIYYKHYSKYKISLKVVNDLIQQLKEWVSAGYVVIAFRMPSSCAMEALENKMTQFEKLNLPSKILELGAHWYYFDCNDYYSYDGSHLHKDSAVKFSLNLAKKIKSALSSKSH